KFHDGFHSSIMNGTRFRCSLLQTHFMLETRSTLQTHFILDKAGSGDIGSGWRMIAAVSV
ncbi:MAG: hypothetical protein PHX24_08735, partial [Acidithiobacillus sp.]|nr:hypothetical protein [Acidithiobacillus sp.]